jgi:prevent-host-death family protein
MEITNVQEAKTHLSRLMAEVQAGKEAVIGKAGKPIAKLVPTEHDASERI